MPSKEEILRWMRNNYTVDRDGVNCISLQEDACFHFNLYEGDDLEERAPDWLYDLAIDACSDIEQELAMDEEIKKEEDKMCRCASFW